MKVKINDAALKKLLVTNTKAVDRKIRQRHAGKPAAEIIKAVQRELAGAGLNLPKADLEKYVASVSERRDFQFNFIV